MFRSPFGALLSAIQLFQVSRPTPAPPSWTAVDNISPGSAVQPNRTRTSNRWRLVSARRSRQRSQQQSKMVELEFIHQTRNLFTIFIGKQRQQAHLSNHPTLPPLWPSGLELVRFLDNMKEVLLMFQCIPEKCELCPKTTRNQSKIDFSVNQRQQVVINNIYSFVQSAGSFRATHSLHQPVSVFLSHSRVQLVVLSATRPERRSLAR